LTVNAGPPGTDESRQRDTSNLLARHTSRQKHYEGVQLVREIILQVFVLSLDGVIQTEGTDFEKYYAELPDDAAHERALVESIGNASLHAVGRVTYESMAQYFPNVTHEEGANPMSTSAIDEAMNRIPKVVFSNTLDSADWAQTTIVRGDTKEELERLRHGGDGYVLVHGGVSFARSLVELDVVDEYRITVCPYVAGTGPRLFPDGLAARTLELVSCDTFSNGLVWLVYRRRHKAR
jgi:dihydrofolate reductase